MSRLGKLQAPDRPAHRPPLDPRFRVYSGVAYLAPALFYQRALRARRLAATGEVSLALRIVRQASDSVARLLHTLSTLPKAGPSIPLSTGEFALGIRDVVPADQDA